METDDGVLDEALERLHGSGPEREDRLTNHAPMAVEALARRGHSRAVHGWLDRYRDKLTQAPAPYARVTAVNWQQALGDPRRLADWSEFFLRETADHAWREVLARWWPRLLPGISGAATHPVIRVGHAVRTLLAAEETGPRGAELAHALGYWAARHAVLPEHRERPATGSAAGALDAVRAVPDQNGGIRERFALLSELPAWPATAAVDPDAARDRLAELVRAATHRYATHAHGSAVMFVHTATAPNAVLRTLPALPRSQWEAGLRAAWAASAAVTAAYTPHEAAAAPDARGLTAEEVFARAAAHGDEHTVKLADTALDVGDELALSAGLRAVQLIEPLG